MTTNKFVEKYQVAAPRYISYPTVPYWDTDKFNTDQWAFSVKETFKLSNSKDGISLYIHFPFCESLCNYCGCNTRITKSPTVEFSYIEAVLKEWRLYLDIISEKPVIREIHLGGGTPTFFSPANLKLLVKGILKFSRVHKQAEFSFEGHPANTTVEHLIALHKLGFKRMSLGIQDFDPKVQLAINRVQTFKEVKEITRLARNQGYNSINYDLIYGLPLQTIDSLVSTIEKVLKLKPDRIVFYSYPHVPSVKPGQRTYTEDDLPSDVALQDLNEIGRKFLKAGGYTEIGMDHFTLKSDSLFKSELEGTLHRNSMGYTHQYSKLMIGLGVSSISDTWNAFAQNVKKVEDYINMVNSGQLPVVKGHILNEEDLVIRKHIINIMCQGYTSWNLPEERNEALEEGLKRMRWLAQDGLVMLSSDGLHVTPFGKRFLRNICMTLDARLWENQPQSQLFSVAG